MIVELDYALANPRVTRLLGNKDSQIARSHGNRVHSRTRECSAKLSTHLNSHSPSKPRLADLWTQCPYRNARTLYFSRAAGILFVLFDSFYLGR